jgi:transposase
MSLTADSLPDDVATLKAMLIAADAARLAAEAEAKARALLIEQMKFTIAKLRHEQYGQSSERGAILEQLELQLADLEEDASEAEAQARLAAAAAATAKVQVEGFQRKRPARRPLPEHLLRERVVHPAPTSCPCCGAAILILARSMISRGCDRLNRG